MKLADVETLVDEVAEQAYEKACEAVANTPSGRKPRKRI